MLRAGSVRYILLFFVSSSNSGSYLILGTFCVSKFRPPLFKAFGKASATNTMTTEAMRNNYLLSFPEVIVAAN